MEQQIGRPAKAGLSAPSIAELAERSIASRCQRDALSEEIQMYYVYIIQSEKNSTYYIGYTKSLEGRLEKHNCKHRGYTAKYAPYRLVYSESYSLKVDAIRREKVIKSYKGGEAFKKLCRVGGAVNRT